MPHITTNHAITYTNCASFCKKWRNYALTLIKTSQYLCNIQVNGKHVYPVSIILVASRAHNSQSDDYKNWNNQQPARGRHFGYPIQLCSGGVRQGPQRFMGKTVTVPHFNRDTVEFEREMNQTQGSKHCCLFRKTLLKRVISRIFKISQWPQMFAIGFIRQFQEVYRDSETIVRSSRL